MAKPGIFDRLPVVHQLRQSVGLQRGMLVAGLVLTAFFLLLAIFAPWLAPYGFAQLRGPDGGCSARSSRRARSTAGHDRRRLRRPLPHDLGCPDGALVIIVALLLSVFLGILLGLVSGYLGGWLDRSAGRRRRRDLRLPDRCCSRSSRRSPSAAGNPASGRGIMAAAISITVVFIPQYFRVVRSEVVRVKSEAFVESAKVIGASTPRIMFVHVCATATRTLPLIITLNASEAIATLAALGFLGFGIEPTAAAEWGYDLKESIGDVSAGIWWTAIPPGTAIVLAILGMTLIGESLNDLADPRLRARRRAGKQTRRGCRGGVAAGHPRIHGRGRVMSALPAASDALAVEIRDLNVTFAMDGADVHAVRGVTLDVRRGEVLAIVGESGSGKTVTATNDSRTSARRPR